MHSVQYPNYVPSQKDFKRWQSLEKNIRKCCYGVTVYNHNNYTDRKIVLNSPFKTCIDVAKQRAEFSATNIQNCFSGQVEVETRIDMTSKMPEFCVFHNGRMIFTYQVTVQKKHYF